APAEEVAHQAEDLLRAIFQGKGTLTEDRFDLLAKVTQRLEQIVAAFRAHQPLPEAGPLIHELTALCPKSAEAAEPARTVEAPRPPLAEADLSFAANAALSQ